MKANLLSLHGDFEGDPQIIDESSFDKPQYDKLEILPNNCIENSYKFAITNNCSVIEGLLVTKLDGQVVSIEPHCWNKINKKYYDTTIDCLHATSRYKEIIGDKKEELIYYQCVEYSPQDSGYQINQSTFYYNYNFLADFINSNLGNDK